MVCTHRASQPQCWSTGRHTPLPRVRLEHLRASNLWVCHPQRVPEHPGAVTRSAGTAAVWLEEDPNHDAPPLSTEDLLEQPPASLLAALKQANQLWVAQGSQIQAAQARARMADTVPALTQCLSARQAELQPRQAIQAAVLYGTLPGCDMLLLSSLCEGSKGSLATIPAGELAELLPVLAQRGLRPNDALLTELLRALGDRLSTLHTEECVGVLVSLVRLGVRPTSTWLLAWEDATRAEHQGLKFKHLSAMAWALGEIRFQPGPAWMAGFLGATQQRFPDGTALELTELLVGLGRLSATPPILSRTWRRSALDAAYRCLPGLRAVDLARLLAGAAALGLSPPPAWVEAAAARVLDSMDSASARDLIDSASALLDLSATQPVHAHTHTASSGSDTDTDSPVGRRGSGSRGGRRGTARAKGTGGSPPGDLQQGTQSATHNSDGNKIASQQGDGLSRDVLGAVLPSWCTKPWQQAFLQAAQRRLPQFTASGLAQLLLLLARMRAAPAPAWAGEYQTHLVAKIDAVGHQELGAVPGALLALSVAPRKELTAGLQRASASRLSLLADGTLLDMATCLDQLPNVTWDTQWTQAFMLETEQRLSRLDLPLLCRLPGLILRLRAPAPSHCWTALYKALAARLMGAAGLQAGLGALTNAEITDLLWGLSASPCAPPEACVRAVMSEAQRRVEAGKRRDT